MPTQVKTQLLFLKKTQLLNFKSLDVLHYIKIIQNIFKYIFEGLDLTVNSLVVETEVMGSNNL